MPPKHTQNPKLGGTANAWQQRPKPQSAATECIDVDALSSDHDDNDEVKVTKVPTCNGEKRARRPANTDRLGSGVPTTTTTRRPTPAVSSSAAAAGGSAPPNAVVATTMPTLSYVDTPASAATDTNNTTSSSKGSMGNPHELPMKYKIGDLGNIRAELRGKYRPSDTIGALIPNGDRTATTRQPPKGVSVGHYVHFTGVEGLYQISGFEKVNLDTPEGVELWSRREGWSPQAAFTFGSQVATGRTQILYQRVQ